MSKNKLQVSTFLLCLIEPALLALDGYFTNTSVFFNLVASWIIGMTLAQVGVYFVIDYFTRRPDIMRAAKFSDDEPSTALLNFSRVLGVLTTIYLAYTEHYIVAFFDGFSVVFGFLIMSKLRELLTLAKQVKSSTKAY